MKMSTYIGDDDDDARPFPSLPMLHALLGLLFFVYALARNVTIDDAAGDDGAMVPMGLKA